MIAVPIVRAEQYSYGILLRSSCLSFIQVILIRESFDLDFFFVVNRYVVELVVIGGTLREKRGFRDRFSSNGERGRGTLRLSIDEFADRVIDKLV